MSATSNPGEEGLVLVRYALIGGIATLCHFAVLYIAIEKLGIKPVGVANAVAAIIGSFVAFLGNRYFTFRATAHSMRSQLVKFIALYATGAVWHGASMYLWSDVWSLDYRVGFILVTVLQVTGIYFGNRFFVFRAPSWS